MKVIKYICAIFLCLTFECTAGFRLIRDAEIETLLLEMVRPIFKVSGLREDAARVFIIDSDTMNAFTIGNGYIFVYTGLLLRLDSMQLMGVLAHETAHIAAGHINRLMAVLQNRSRNFTGAMMAGLLASIVTRSEKPMAMMMGYLMADERFFLHYSRGEEFAADALGASFLEKMGYGSQCMVSLLQKFQNFEIMNPGANMPEYIMSHPKLTERISALRKRPQNFSKQLTNDFQERYRLGISKIRAYKKNYQGDEYAKAICLHKVGNNTASIKILQDLSSKNPRNIFYKETLAQFLYEAGRLKDSVQLYKQIYESTPRDKLHPLIQISYAEVLIAANQDLNTAVKILETIKLKEYFDENIYRLLANAYGKQKHLGLSYLMSANEKMLMGDYLTAEELIKLSLANFDKNRDKNYIEQAEYLQELISRKK